MKILEKLFCGHKWKSHAKQNREQKDGYGSTNVYQYTLEVLVCEKCGKIKKIEY